MKLYDWREEIDLSPYKKEIASAAKKRESQKKGYKTSRQWSKQATNLTGLKGEYAFHLCTGLPVDLSLNAHGDRGADFSYEGILYDVKTTLFKGGDPALLEMTDKKLVSHVYVLVKIDGWTARIIGYASRKQMRHSQKRDFSNGERLSILESEMKELGQDTIPPLVPSISTDPRIAEQRSAAQKIHTDTVITLPKCDRKKPMEKRYCFPHGPFERRRSSTSQWDAIYCKECGRFYGYSREPQLIEDD
tara:strand:- start:450 stop:1190 length:741 start_codon:yes stop_codon:yes gene_type:complete